MQTKKDNSYDYYIGLESQGSAFKYKSTKEKLRNIKQSAEQTKFESGFLTTKSGELID